jgi:hypothetical protein
MIPDELTSDLQRLKEAGYSFEVSENGNRIYILFKDFVLPPDTYNAVKIDLLIFTTPYYPNAGFDMFWVSEGLLLKSGSVPAGASTVEPYLGRNWRRFSYHPFNSKPWNPAEDSVVTYIEYVNQRLRRGD